KNNITFLISQTNAGQTSLAYKIAHISSDKGTGSLNNNNVKPIIICHNKNYDYKKIKILENLLEQEIIYFHNDEQLLNIIRKEKIKKNPLIIDYSLAQSSINDFAQSLQLIKTDEENVEVY